MLISKKIIVAALVFNCVSFSSQVLAQAPCKSNYVRSGGESLIETICNVRGLLRQPTNRPGAYLIRHGEIGVEVRQDHLNNLLSVFERILVVSGMSATLKIVLDDSVNAYAIPADRTVTFTSGLLMRGGADIDLLAAVVGHELAHLKLRHEFFMALTAVDSFKGVVIQRNVAENSGRSVNSNSLSRNYLRNIRAFSRTQELEADKLGTEWISEAKFNPNGILKFLDLASKNGMEGNVGYLSTHPGGVERAQNAGLVVQNQLFDMQAANYFTRGEWRNLQTLVASWQKAFPESARAYYYRGVLEKRFKRKGALEAFEKSVLADPMYLPARIALCIELYHLGELRASLLCSEYIPRGELLEQYEQATFGYPVYVGGFAPRINVTAQDVIIAQTLCRMGLCQ